MQDQANNVTQTYILPPDNLLSIVQPLVATTNQIHFRLEYAIRNLQGIVGNLCSLVQEASALL